MPHEVIMPALGMAQTTGKLLSWLKKPGDPVAAGEVLFEVETDKSVSEVEAAADGYLTDVTASEGEDVPVGVRIAMISETADDTGASKPQAAEPVAAPAIAETRKAPVVVAPAKPAVRQAPAQPAAGGRILASPKARRLAQERGVELRLLVDAGVSQPFHVADLDHAALHRASRTGQVTGVLTASCDRGAFESFLTAMIERASVDLEPHVLAAAFAASSLRPFHDRATLVVAVEAGPKLRRVLYLDPDLLRPSRPRLAPEGTIPDLVLRDLTWSPITSAALASDPAPALTLCVAADRFALTLAFSQDDLALEEAVALLTGMAERLENPLENLV